jgi:predicted RNase H-like nuclease (RuvC/YqgF family)
MRPVGIVYTTSTTAPAPEETKAMEMPERIAKLEAQVEAIKDDVAELKSDVKEIHSRITTGNREIMQKIDEKIDHLAKSDSEQHASMVKSINDMKERVDVLERWKWMIVGGAISIGYLISHLELFAKIMK